MTTATPSLSFASRHSAPSDLSSREVADMRELMNRHFAGVDHAQFERDLMAKDWVLRLFAADALVGFSSLAVDTAVVVEEAPVNVIYSGDTIMDPRAWSSLALPKSWIQLVETITVSLPPFPCYWLLISSGFRTYRFLPVFWREFWPRFDRPTPRAPQTLLDALAERRFGPQFDPDRSIVQLQRPYRLRPHLNESACRRAKADPHIDFFLKSNPHWEKGDELVCLTELSRANLSPAGKRIWRPEIHES